MTIEDLKKLLQGIPNEVQVFVKVGEGIVPVEYFQVSYQEREAIPTQWDDEPRMREKLRHVTGVLLEGLQPQPEEDEDDY